MMNTRIGMMDKEKNISVKKSLSSPFLFTTKKWKTEVKGSR